MRLSAQFPNGSALSRTPKSRCVLFNHNDFSCPLIHPATILSTTPSAATGGAPSSTSRLPTLSSVPLAGHTAVVVVSGA